MPAGCRWSEGQGRGRRPDSCRNSNFKGRSGQRSPRFQARVGKHLFDKNSVQSAEFFFSLPTLVFQFVHVPYDICNGCLPAHRSTPVPTVWRDNLVWLRYEKLQRRYPCNSHFFVFAKTSNSNKCTVCFSS